MLGKSLRALVGKFCDADCGHFLLIMWVFLRKSYNSAEKKRGSFSKREQIFAKLRI